LVLSQWELYGRSGRRWQNLPPLGKPPPNASAEIGLEIAERRDAAARSSS
jgi:hypothetical protein